MKRKCSLEGRDFTELPHFFMQKKTITLGIYYIISTDVNPNQWMNLATSVYLSKELLLMDQFNLNGWTRSVTKLL